jgi:site-specific recombinase XerD
MQQAFARIKQTTSRVRAEKIYRRTSSTKTGSVTVATGERTMESVNDSFFGFKEHLKVLNRSPATVEAYSEHVQAFLDTTAVDVRAVTRTKLEAWIAGLYEHKTREGKPYRPGTICLKVRSVKRFFEYLKSVRPELLRDPYEKTVFLSGRHKPLSKNMVWELTKKYSKKAKIPKNVHPHTFRHTCATQMLRNKAHIRAVQELLGHSSLDSTQVYTHVSITDLKEIHKSCHPREKDKE